MYLVTTHRRIITRHRVCSFDASGDISMRLFMQMSNNYGFWMVGEARLQFFDHTSRTLHEYPTIADVDKEVLLK